MTIAEPKENLISRKVKSQRTGAELSINPRTGGDFNQQLILCTQQVRCFSLECR